MDALLQIGLSNAVAALALALIALAAGCVWRRPALRHALWLLVLLKLVTPPLAWVSVPWPTGATTRSAAVSAAAEEPAVAFDHEPTVAAPTGGEAPDPAPPDSSPVPPPGDSSGGLLPPPADEPKAAVIDWATATLAVWLLGAVAWYGLAVVRLRRFGRLLRHASPAPQSLRRRVRRLAGAMHLRRPPTAWLVPGRVAPMLWAAGGRPRLLFPAGLLGRVGVEQQDALLVHELAHLRRRDHWVRWLEFVTAGLYWWHPVLWLARRELREAEEQCCDAWVTSTLPGAGRTYATALLETLEFLSDAPPAVPSLASGVGPVADLKRRLTMILSGKTPRALGWRAGLAVLGVAALALPLLPAWARAQPGDKANNKLPEAVVAGSPDGSAVLRGGGASPEEMDKARAELKAAEADLAQKQAETAAAMARVRLLRERVAAGEARPGVPLTAQAGGGGVVVKVISEEDAKAGAVKDLLKQIQATQPNAAPIVVLDEKTGRIIMKVEGGKAEAADVKPLPRVIMVSPGDAAGPAGLGGGTAGPAPAADTDKRIEDLEKRLKSILNEVEKLRRERKEGAPQGGAGAAGGGAPSLNKIPYLDSLFTNARSAEMERAQAMMARDMAERAAVDRAAAEAQRKAAEERIKRLEEEIQWLKKADNDSKRADPAKP